MLTGELANAPRAGSGTVTLKREMVVPLADFKGPVSTGYFLFWPFLTNDGTIKWGYQYTAHPQIQFGTFESVE